MGGLWLRAWLLLGQACGGAEGSAGVVQFHQEFHYMLEQSKYFNVNLLRVGGSSGLVRAKVAVVNASTNATLGSDFVLYHTEHEWHDGDASPRAVSIVIQDDQRYDATKTIQLTIQDVVPAAAKGAILQSTTISVSDKLDGGVLDFDEQTVVVPEQWPQEPACLFSVTRSQGQSGIAEMWLELVPCSSMEETNNLEVAFEEIDFFVSMLNASAPLTWQDGESDPKCALWSWPRGWSSNETLNVNALLVAPDGEVESQEAICFKTHVTPGSAAQVSSTKLVVFVQDAGIESETQFHCHRGNDCTVQFNLNASQLLDNDMIYWDKTCSSCSSLDNESFIPMFNAALPLEFGGVFDNSNPDSVLMCLCREASLRFDHPIVLGRLSLYGPRKENNAMCAKGARCVVPALEGVWQYEATSPERQGDRLQIMTECGNNLTTPLAFKRGGRASLNGSANGAFEMESPMEMAREDPGMYRLCWCRVGFRNNCEHSEDFVITAGVFVFSGPFYQPVHNITMGDTLVVDSVAGILLNPADVVRLQRTCGVDDGEPIQAETDPSARAYDFGELADGNIGAGQYELCWCDASAACNRSEEFRAFFGYVGVRCPKLMVSLGDGTCGLCPYFFLSPDEERLNCEFGLVIVMQVVLSYVFGILGLAILMCQVELVRNLPGHEHAAPRLLGRRMYIEDVSPEGDRLILTTSGKHYLQSFRRGMIPVSMFGTGHFLLDNTPEQRQNWFARVDSKTRLELVDAAGKPRAERADTSMGLLVLSVPRTLLHTHPAATMPLLLVAPILLALSAILLFVEFVDSEPPSEGFLIAWIVIQLVAASLLTMLWKLRTPPTHMAERLRQYDRKLTVDNPKPEACPRGPGRAVSAFQLFELHDFFQAFIKDRTMYYLDPNIVRPLCKAFRLSYAERVGPNTVNWFVSHFWGTQFRVFCEAIRRHATATCGSDDEQLWKVVSYWICTFSNNQYNILQEIGVSHHDSSFYLALTSSGCQGTCMILDELALPLTRSWCLFELLQTMNRTKVDEQFKGLLFCTQTGVLNYGAATVELSMNIGKRLAGLRLQDAKATSQKDKDMIENLVIKEMGSFEAINKALRENIHHALLICQKHVDEDFGVLFSELSGNLEATTTAPEPPPTAL